MSIDEKQKITVTLNITADDIESALVLMEEAESNIEQGSLAGNIGGSFGFCLFSVDEQSRAAELPLEPQGDTPKACEVSHQSFLDDDENTYLFCPYCGERLSS